MNGPRVRDSRMGHAHRRVCSQRPPDREHTGWGSVPRAPEPAEHKLPRVDVLRSPTTPNGGGMRCESAEVGDNPVAIPDREP